METDESAVVHSTAGTPLSRREFVALSAAGLLSFQQRRQVTIGVQSYSFRDRSLDDAIAAMQKIGLQSCELWQGHIEPPKQQREERRVWRETVSLDFTATNENAVAFLKEHHDRIVTLHIKDRKRNQGDHVPIGAGDAPIDQVLKLVRDNGWPIPMNLEYEYKGGDTVVEVQKMYEYCKRTLNL